MQSIAALIPEIALSAALAWGAGIRLYAVVFLLGAAGRFGWIELPAHLHLLQESLVLAASGFMTLVEFFTDKVPWIDSLWDLVHTFIRIPAGAALAAGVFGAGDESVALAAAIIGGAISAGAHLTKAGTRGVINTSPEPFSNWAASLLEDVAVPAGLWFSISHPFAFLVALALAALGALALVAWIARGLARLLRRLLTRSPA